MPGSFCTALLLHFSKRFDIANLHFSIKIVPLIIHFSDFGCAGLYQLQKVDTEKIFQLNIFSRVPDAPGGGMGVATGEVRWL